MVWLYSVGGNESTGSSSRRWDRWRDTIGNWTCEGGIWASSSSRPSWWREEALEALYLSMVGLCIVWRNWNEGERSVTNCSIFGWSGSRTIRERGRFTKLPFGLYLTSGLRLPSCGLSSQSLKFDDLTCQPRGKSLEQPLGCVPKRVYSRSTSNLRLRYVPLYFVLQSLSDSV